MHRWHAYKGVPLTQSFTGFAADWLGQNLKAFDGRRWTCFRSGRVCAITYARIQGKQAMIQRFQNSSLLAESLEVQPRLFVSHGVDKGKPERFPGGAELPIEIPPPVVEPPSRRTRSRPGRSAERRAR